MSASAKTAALRQAIWKLVSVSSKAMDSGSPSRARRAAR